MSTGPVELDEDRRQGDQDHTDDRVLDVVAHEADVAEDVAANRPDLFSAVGGHSPAATLTPIKRLRCMPEGFECGSMWDARTVWGHESQGW